MISLLSGLSIAGIGWWTMPKVWAVGVAVPLQHLTLVNEMERIVSKDVRQQHQGHGRYHRLPDPPDAHSGRYHRLPDPPDAHGHAFRVKRAGTKVKLPLPQLAAPLK